MKKIIMDKMIDKTKAFKILIIIVFTFFSFAKGWCTTYYVDYSTGLDTNNGTSTSTPFKHCPGDTAASNTAGSIVLTAGDRVIFKGGITYTGTTNDLINISWSGSGDGDSQRIIYDGDSGTYAARWASGTDKAIIDGGGIITSPRYLFYFDYPQSYITINGFVIKRAREAYDTYTAPVTYAGYLIRNTNSSHYVTVSNNDMSDAGITNVDMASGSCLQNSNGNYWKIHHNTVTDCGSGGILLTTVNYNEVYNNTITGRNSWGFSLATSGNSTMYSNYFHDNVMIDMNRCCHVNDIHGNWTWFYTGQGSVDTTGSMVDTRIYNNLFYNSYSGYTIKSVAFINLSVSNNGGAWDGLYIYNNVMFNGDTAGINVGTFPGVTGSMKNVYIYDNTFYSPSGQTGTIILNGSSTADPTKLQNVYVINNTLYTTGGLTMSVPPPSSVSGTYQIDYNNHYSSRANYQISTFDNVQGRKYLDWTGWQALAFDANGRGPLSDPLYRDVTIGSGFDLRLQLGSPCIDVGCALGVPYNTDKNGTSRPQGSAWDIGAYEYGPGDPPPPSSPPSSPPSRAAAASGGGGGGCFIATAAYGSYLDPHVNVLRNFRDKYVLPSAFGRTLVGLYYEFSPGMANFIERHENMKVVARCIISPIVYCIEYPYFLVILVALGIMVIHRVKGYSKRSSSL